MFHAASMGAHSCAENLEPVLDHYYIYSFDNPGEGNKSELNDALVFPSSPKEVADLYKKLLDVTTYPKPSSGEIFLKVPESLIGAKICIYDISGKLY
jgi:hypothetical protein